MYNQKIGLLDHLVISLVAAGLSILFSKMAVVILNSHQHYTRFLFSPHPPYFFFLFIAILADVRFYLF